MAQNKKESWNISQLSFLIYKLLKVNRMLYDLAFYLAVLAKLNGLGFSAIL